MKYYLVDDDEMVLRILEDIIEDENLGEIIGSNSNSEFAMNEIKILKPDAILIDLLMPVVDGIKLVQQMKNISSNSKFVMISQVNDKSMISKAYEAGIEFYIQKPINKIELVKILENINKMIDLENKFNLMKGIFDTNLIGNTQIDVSESETVKDRIQNITYIFTKLGIAGEKGSKDILTLCEYLLSNQGSSYDVRLQDICNQISDNPRAMEQRIRRTINKGLSNIANLGLEDYMNDVFTAYGNALFDFENVKAEMDYVRGKRDSGGKINVKKFIDNLIIASEY